MFKTSRRAGEQSSTKQFFALNPGNTSGGIVTTSLARGNVDELKKLEELNKIEKKLEAIYNIFDETKGHDIEGIIGYLRRGI